MRMQRSFEVFHVDVCEQHAGTGPRRDESRLIGFADVAGIALKRSFRFLCLAGDTFRWFFVDIMHHLVVLFLDALNGLILISGNSAISIRNRFLHDLVVLILTVKFYLQVILLRVDLIGQFGLLYDVPHVFELIDEEHELPDQPNHGQKESGGG